MCVCVCVCVCVFFPASFRFQLVLQYQNHMFEIENKLITIYLLVFALCFKIMLCLMSCVSMEGTIFFALIYKLFSVVDAC